MLVPSLDNVPFFQPGEYPGAEVIVIDAVAQGGEIDPLFAYIHAQNGFSAQYCIQHIVAEFVLVGIGNAVALVVGAPPYVLFRVLKYGIEPEFRNVKREIRVSLTCKTPLAGIV